MEQNLKKIIAVLAVLFLCSVAYYGSFLPLQKSIAFIGAMQSTGSVHSISDFENLFKGPLDLPSPIGQEELVRNTASSILGTLQNVSDPRVVTELNRYITQYYEPILARGRGMSFGQDVYLMGALNELSFVKTQDSVYLSAAEQYYQEAVSLGPNRPQGLYGLFDIYRMEGNVAGVQQIGEKILSQWPTDSRTRSALSDFLATHGGATSSVSTTPAAK